MSVVAQRRKLLNFVRPNSTEYSKFINILIKRCLDGLIGIYDLENMGIATKIVSV